MVKHEFLALKDVTTGFKHAVIDATTGDNTIVAAVSGKRIRVYQLVLMADAAVAARFESGAGGTALTGVMPLAANTGFAPGWCPVGQFETAAGSLLNLEVTGAGNVDGWLVYAEV